jgi:lincosamide nucleotidyltransferase A/C/D/E
LINAEDVIRIYLCLSDNGIPIWLTGGWGIDALLGEQTRPHKDLDVIMLLEDVVQLRALLEQKNYALKDLWEENRQAVDKHGIETATAFVFQDKQGREIDIHAFILDGQGNGIPAWEAEDGFIFKKEDLEGKGTVAGFAVQCLSPEMQVRCHQGYEVPEKQLLDLKRLHAKFGVV